MNTPRTIDEIMRDMNAWAMAEGIALGVDPWSIPPIEGSILDNPPTPEAEARIARLRARRLARAESAKRASEQAREAQDKANTDNGEQCLQTAMDLFCRVNIQSDLPHKEFVSFIARSVGGVSRMYTVKSDMLDISVDDNDMFDAVKARVGDDRWLYFRYTLEIDPVEGTSPSNYIEAINGLLKSLWSSGLDAIAGCEFEDQLPQNARRLNWDDRGKRTSEEFPVHP